MPHENHDTTDYSGVHKEPKLSPQKHNEFGEEILDPTPMQPPLGYKRTLSLAEQIAQQVRISQLQILEANLLEETEDDADDFEIGEDYEPLSPHENDHMPTLANLKKKALEINAEIKRKQTEIAVEAYKDNIKKTQAVTSPPAQPINNDLTTKDPDENDD